MSAQLTRPHLRMHWRLFSPHARSTRLTPEGVDYMDLGSFRDMAEELIEVGADATSGRLIRRLSWQRDTPHRSRG
jgi:hypothetical protein